jgi:tRNA-dihydrouridine synthase
LITGGASTYGATLMKDPSLTGRLVESMANAAAKVEAQSSDNSIGISVKCQIGVYDTAEDYNQSCNHNIDDEYLANYISMIHDVGANHVILHARPAILSLNPVKNRVIPTY